MNIDQHTRRKELGTFLLAAFGNWHGVKLAKKACYCKVCGLSMFPSVVIGSGTGFGFDLPESCECKREFNPTEFTLCPNGALYVGKENVE